MRLTPEKFRLLRKDLSNNEHTEWVGVEDFIHMLEKNGRALNYTPDKETFDPTAFHL